MPADRLLLQQEQAAEEIGQLGECVGSHFWEIRDVLNKKA
jgi:hypothetical protein